MITKLTVADGRGGLWRLGVSGGGYEAAQGQRGHPKVGVLVLVPAELRRKQSERGSRQGKRKREEDAGGTVVGRPGCPDERPARCVSLNATRTRFLSFLTRCATRVRRPQPTHIPPSPLTQRLVVSRPSLGQCVSVLTTLRSPNRGWLPSEGADLWMDGWIDGSMYTLI